MSRLLDKYNQFDETSLWKDYRVSKNSEIRAYLVEKYSPLVKHVAGRGIFWRARNVAVVRRTSGRMVQRGFMGQERKREVRRSNAIPVFSEL